MTYCDFDVLPHGGDTRAGQVSESISRVFERFSVARRVEFFSAVDGRGASSQKSPQAENLSLIHNAISDFSMHLPKGFASGLSKQFANLMDEDAWEEEDQFIGNDALKTLLLMLLNTRTNRRPGIGTDGKGSVTASWRAGGNRLIVECLPDGTTSLLVTHIKENGDKERAAFKSICPKRVLEVLEPFSPEVWFDS